MPSYSTTAQAVYVTDGVVVEQLSFHVQFVLLHVEMQHHCEISPSIALVPAHMRQDWNIGHVIEFKPKRAWQC